MKRILFFVLSLAVSTSCSTNSKLTRKGYTLSENQKVKIGDCKVFITSKKSKLFEAAKKLGTIEASDSGMGVNCQEDYVIRNFISDACALGANVLNITSETQPNFWSTCYRAEADFLSMENTSGLTTDPNYYPEQILKRSHRGHDKTRAAMGGGIIGGVLSAVVIN
jgi:hypothetical protein